MINLYETFVLLQFSFSLRLPCIKNVSYSRSMVIFFNVFRRFLFETAIRRIPEGETTTMIEVIIMVIEKGTGIQIQSCDHPGVAIIATKVRSQSQNRSGWQLVRAVLRGHGVHTDTTRLFLTRTVQSVEIPLRTVTGM
jgi:hypothetical protein